MRNVFIIVVLFGKYLYKIRLHVCLMKYLGDVRCIKVKYNADFIVSASVERKKIFEFVHSL